MYREKERERTKERKKRERESLDFNGSRFGHIGGKG